MSSRSLHLLTLFLSWLKSSKWLTSTYAYTFTSNWQLPFLNQQKRKGVRGGGGGGGGGGRGRGMTLQMISWSISKEVMWPSWDFNQQSDVLPIVLQSPAFCSLIRPISEYRSDQTAWIYKLICLCCLYLWYCSCSKISNTLFHIFFCQNFTFYAAISENT